MSDFLNQVNDVRIAVSVSVITPHSDRLPEEATALGIKQHSCPWHLLPRPPASLPLDR